jgi:hypothetical protein
LHGPDPRSRRDDRRGSRSGDRFELGELGSLTIGSGDAVDVQLEDDTVSRMHLRLSAGEQGVTVVDEGSRNGTRLGRTRVTRIVGEHDGGPFLVMPYVEGESLRALLGTAGEMAAPRCEPAIAVRIAIDALTGLHAIHEAASLDGRRLGIVHRDVSPHNLLVTLDGLTRVEGGRQHELPNRHRGQDAVDEVCRLRRHPPPRTARAQPAVFPREGHKQVVLAPRASQLDERADTAVSCAELIEKSAAPAAVHALTGSRGPSLADPRAQTARR